MPAAIALLKQAADKNPDGRIVTTLAEMYESDKQYSKAADAWKLALPLTNDESDGAAQVRAEPDSVAAVQRRPSRRCRRSPTDDPKNPEFLLQLIGVYDGSEISPKPTPRCKRQRRSAKACRCDGRSRGC